MKMQDRMPPPSGERLDIVARNREGKVVEVVTDLGTRAEIRELKALGSHRLADRWRDDDANKR